MCLNLKVLVADDNPDHVRLITEILSRELKAEVESVTKGEECLKKVEKNRYDLLFLDYLLPEISGLDILKDIAEKGRDLPIIIITGHGSEKVAVEAMKAGAVDYIVKSEDGFQSLPFVAKRAIEKDQLRKKLRQTEEKFQNLFENATDAIMYLDRAGRILDSNKQALEVFGASKLELLGKLITRLSGFPPGEIPALLNIFAGVLAGREVTQDLCITNKKGQERILECSSSFMKTDDKVMGVMIIARDITERKKDEEELRQAHERLRALTAHLESARENERTRIARELHDELGQVLTALKIDLDWIIRRLRKEDTDIRAKTDIMRGLIDDTINTVRRISTQLRPGLLDDMGLAAAMEWQTKEVAGRAGLEYELALGQEDIVLDKELATALFRIFQETLTNVVRHAGATRIRVLLDAGPDELVLTISDDGKGINESQVSDLQSLGLIGMRERIRAWGGVVLFQGIAGQGTTVALRVPRKT